MLFEECHELSVQYKPRKKRSQLRYSKYFSKSASSFYDNLSRLSSKYFSKCAIIFKHECQKVFIDATDMSYLRLALLLTLAGSLSSKGERIYGFPINLKVYYAVWCGVSQRFFLNELKNTWEALKGCSIV